jgi:hypothetical protein
MQLGCSAGRVPRQAGHEMCHTVSMLIRRGARETNIKGLRPVRQVSVDVSTF